jgi:hypothetical protein
MIVTRDRGVFATIFTATCVSGTSITVVTVYTSIGTSGGGRTVISGTCIVIVAVMGGMFTTRVYFTTIICTSITIIAINWFIVTFS